MTITLMLVLAAAGGLVIDIRTEGEYAGDGDVAMGEVYFNYPVSLDLEKLKDYTFPTGERGCRGLIGHGDPDDIE